MNVPVPMSGGGGLSVPSQLQSLAGALSNWRGVMDGLTGDLLSRLRAALTLGQDTRLLQLETALASGTLVVERCRVHESVHANEPLWAEIDCVSTSASLALKALTGEAATLKLQLADGSWRHWHGHVVQTAQLGADGGLARYRLTLAAWTHWLLQRRDTRIFQDLNAQDIVSQVCAAYPQARFRFDVAQAGPVRALTTQYRETDWAFAQRLMAQEGWSWRLEHEANQHTLVIFDELADVPDVGSLRFGRTDIRGRDGLGEDKITAWSVGQQMGPNAITLGAWDERQIGGVSANASALTPQDNVPTLEGYAGHGERRFVDGRVTDPLHASSDAADARARAWMAAHDLSQRGAQGHSAVRGLREGASFAIIEHSLYDGAEMGGVDNRFKVISITHEAANNLGAEAAQILQTSDLDQGSYRNQFTAIPADVRLVPLPSIAPTAPGPQTALVVTANGDLVTTDRDGRVRVQFAWQRGAAPLSGGLNAPDTQGGQATGHAPGDAASGTWVRVAQGVAGPNWGAVFTPRAGTEVLVDFVDGDIDRPLIVGQLHNGQHDLPWPAGEDSGANHIGAISGWHLPHLDGGGASQWLVDDSQGQLRMRLATHGSQGGWSELSLGHIIAHSGQGGSGQAQRGAWLGEGFYGHTDGWAIVRAGQGLLLTTSTRSAQGSSVTSTQMDAAEAVAQLKAAQQLGQALSQSAQQQGAQALHGFDDQHAVACHVDAMCPTAKGKHEGSVNGQEAKKADGRTLGDPVERFAQPLVHLDTPVTAAFVTPANISIFSGQDTSVAVQGDVQLTAAHTLSSVSGQTTSLYTHAGGIKAITANGGLSLRAHTDAQQIWADQGITVQSTTDEIRIQASDSITLSAGQSAILIKGGDITFTCPGSWTVKGATHDWGSGGSGSVNFLALPSELVKDRPVVLGNETLVEECYVYERDDGRPIANLPYQTHHDDQLSVGTTNANGETTYVVVSVSGQNSVKPT